MPSLLLRLTVSLLTLTCLCFAQPTLTSLNPTTVVAGSPDFNLTATGSGFTNNSRLIFGTQTLQPFTRTSTSLTVSVPSALVQTDGVFEVRIRNGGQNSGALQFTVTPAPVIPTITSVTPNSSLINPPQDVPLTVAGSNFATNAAVIFGGNALATTRTSATELRATVPKNLLQNAGTIPVTVRNATTNTTSASMPFTVRRRSADLSVTKTDGAASVIAGANVTYTIVVRNNGPDPVSGANIGDAVPGALAQVSWTCSASAGTACTPTGTGNISDNVNLPVNGIVTYTLTGKLAATATGTLANTATVTPPPDTDDPAASNNTATDTNAVGAALVLTTSTLSQGTVGAAYAASLAATGGTAPYTFSVVSGALPAGLSLAANGQISGTPTAAGTQALRFRVRDAANQEVEKELTLVIGAAPLTITTPSPLPSGTAGQAYNQTLAASGGVPPFIWTATNALPPGLTLLGNGQLTGTPNTPGSYAFTVQVRDSASTSNTASKDFQITVLGQLTITTDSNLPNATVNSPYSVTFSASGGTPPIGNWAVVNPNDLPAGLTLSPQGVLSGSPTVSGVFNFRIRAQDASNITVDKSFTLSIFDALTITTTSPLLNGTVGANYQVQLNASGGTQPYTWSVAAGQIPPGLTLLSNGEIAGIPNAPGDYQLTVEVRDATNRTAQRQLQLTVFAQITITTPAQLPPATTGSTYQATLAASGGTPPYAWTLTSGALPPGINLLPGGTLSGTPATPGSFTFTTQVTGGAQSASREFTLQVFNALTVTSPTALPNGQAGQMYSTALTVAGGTPPYTWTLVTGTLPPGLTLVPSGIINGTPTQVGNSSFRLRATDAGGRTAEKDFTIAIQAGGPSFTTASPLADAEAGRSYSVSLQVTGGTPPYTSFTIVQGNLPGGLSLSNEGIISGVPAEASSGTILVRVTDSAGLTDTRSFSITVQGADITISNSPALPAAVRGTPYQVVLSGSGGSGPYTFAVTPATPLPPGLTLTSTGIISGTPTQGGIFRFTIQVRDTLGRLGAKSFEITVEAGGATITDTSPLPAATIRRPYSFTFLTEGGTPPYRWFAEGGVPPGLSLNLSSGVLSGTPTQNGTFRFSVQVTDAGLRSSAKDFQLTVAGELALNPPVLPGAVAGQSYSATLSGSGGTSPYSFSVAGGQLPPGVTLSPAGALSGTPQTAGSFPFTVRISDAAGGSGSRTYSLTVSQVALPAVTISGPGASVNPAEQPAVALSLSSPSPVDLQGDLTLLFTPDAVNPSDDPAIQFSTGGRKVAFTIPAGTTAAQFPVPELRFQTGTVAGVIRIEATFRSANGEVTPGAVPALETRLNRTAPIIRSASVQTVSGGFQLILTGFSPPRSLTQANVRFNARAGTNLQTTQLTVSLNDPANAWFQSEAGRQAGSQFRLTLPFNVNGNVGDIASVTVSLANPTGTSAESTAAF